jgi:hypothetical protein
LKRGLYASLFTGDELARLVKALFSDSAKRTALLEDIAEHLSE